MSVTRMIKKFLLVAAVVLPVAGCGVFARAQNFNHDTGPLITLSGATAAAFSPDQSNPSTHAAKCVVNLTSVTGTVTVTIYGKDGGSGTYYAILASAALNSTGQTVLTVGPGLTASANAVANDYLPALWRIGVAVATGPITGTIGCSLVE